MTMLSGIDFVFVDSLVKSSTKPNQHESVIFGRGGDELVKNVPTPNVG